MQNKKTQSLHILSHKLSDRVFEEVELTELKIYAGISPGQEYIKLSFFRERLNDAYKFNQFVENYIEERRLYKIISKFIYKDYVLPRFFIPNDKKGFEFEKRIGEKIIRHKECKLIIAITISEFEQKLITKNYCSRWTNSIKTLSPRIGQLEKLETLDLSCNNLRELPDEIAKLKQLKSINLSDNLFSEIPKVLLKLDNLTHINLQFNPLKEILDTNLFSEKFTTFKNELNEQKNQAIENQDFEKAASIRDKLMDLDILITEDYYFDYSSMFREIEAMIGNEKE